MTVTRIRKSISAAAGEDEEAPEVPGAAVGAAQVRPDGRAVAGEGGLLVLCDSRRRLSQGRCRLVFHRPGDAGRRLRARRVGRAFGQGDVPAHEPDEADGARAREMNAVAPEPRGRLAARVRVPVGHVQDRPAPAGFGDDRVDAPIVRVSGDAEVHPDDALHSRAFAALDLLELRLVRGGGVVVADVDDEHPAERAPGCSDRLQRGRGRDALVAAARGDESPADLEVAAHDVAAGQQALGGGLNSIAAPSSRR